MDKTIETGFADELTPEQALVLIERLGSEEAVALPSQLEDAEDTRGQVAQIHDGAHVEHIADLWEEALERDLSAFVIDILRLDKEDFSPKRSLMDYGMDSISSTEIGNQFSSKYGIVIPPTVFFEFQDLRGLTRYLLRNHGSEVRAVLKLEPGMSAQGSAAVQNQGTHSATMASQFLRQVAEKSETAPLAREMRSDTSPRSIEALWAQVDQDLPKLEQVMPTVPQARALRSVDQAHMLRSSGKESSQPSREHLAAQQTYVDAARTIIVCSSDGRHIEAAVYGRGQPLLLIGGLAMHYSIMWRLQLRELGERYRLIMYHMPGCGDTSFYEPLTLDTLARDVCELLDGLGIDVPVPILGYSFGGVLAQKICIEHPGRCSALIATVSSPFAEGSSDFQTLMRELQKSNNFMEINRGWNIPFLPVYQKVVEGFDFRTALRRLDIPALIISGTDDKYMPPAFGEQLAQSLPNARYHEYRDTGHLLGFTHSEEFNRLVLEFLDEHVALSRDSLHFPLTLNAFARPEEDTLQVLAEYVTRGDQGHCAILSPQAAQVGLLINVLLARGKITTENYHCFFVTSLHEALDAALRLARHRTRNLDQGNRSEVVLIENDGTWARYFDPLGSGFEDAMVPGIRCFTDRQTAFAYIEMLDMKPAAVVLVCDKHTDSAMADSFVEACGSCGVISVIVEANEPVAAMSHWVGPSCRLPADIYVLGESLTANQLPIGACVARETVCQPWKMTPNESYVRNLMSSFGMPLTVARERLLDAFADFLDEPIRHQLRSFEADATKNYEAHLKYVNPGYARVARLHGFDWSFHSARGLRSGLRTSMGEIREVIDCFANVGSAPRGLNPVDVATEVASQHDSRRDYVNELSVLLAQRTGFERVIFASSNVTAVEAALTLAALAQPLRKKMLFFSGGLGFSMLSAVASHDKVFNIFRKPFEPLYRHSVFIDPQSEQAAQNLEGELLSGEIGLVWFETIQVDANATRPLPRHLIDIIHRCRNSGGYLIGVDETQTNLVTGSLLHSQALVEQPDIVAIGTSLCDSLVPAGAVLCSSNVLGRAVQTNSLRVRDLLERQQCQLAAHISLNSMQKIFAESLDKRAAHVGAHFKRELEQLSKDYPLVCDVRGEGLLLTIELNLAAMDLFLQRSFGYLLWGAMLRDHKQSVAIAVCPIHNNSLRFLPPLTITHEEVNSIVASLRRQLENGISGVLQSSADYAIQLGEVRSAEFLLSLSKTLRTTNKKETRMSTSPSQKQAPLTHKYIERVPGGERMLKNLQARGPGAMQLPCICIIGAGVGGLSMGKALSEYGIEFDCFDERDTLGGIWAFDPDRKHTSIWYSMNQNTPRGLYQFSDFPMPEDYPDFPSHQQVLTYLESYVDHFGFRDRIQLNTSVRKALRRDDGRWDITLGNGEIRQYDALVVANGHHNEPNFPEYHGRDHFEGDSIHSKYYRFRDDYKEKNVLVVGVGNSGSQVAVDISHAAKTTYISLRRGVYVLPHYVFGLRVDKAMAFLNDWWFKKILPYPLFNLVHTGIYNLCIAKHRQMGMPKPDHLLMASLPTLSESFANRIGDGKLKIVPEVARIDGKRVFFVDGSVKEVDSIVYSTGYKTTFPFFDERFLDVSENRISMFKRIFVPEVDNLAFIGLFQAVTWGYLDMMEEQSQLVADYLVGFYRLPSTKEQQSDIAHEQRVIQKEFLATLRNNYEMHGPTYRHELAKEHKRGRKRALRIGIELPFTIKAGMNQVEDTDIEVSSGALASAIATPSAA